MSKVTTLDIELEIMKLFKYQSNLIVPNVTDVSGLVRFETDMLVLTKSLFAYGFEIKVSKSDLKADFEKRHYNKIYTEEQRLKLFYEKFKYFYYAVPIELKEYALELIPDFCGLYVMETHLYLVREPRRLFNRKWTENEWCCLARIGTMRIYNLKSKIKTLRKNNRKETAMPNWLKDQCEQMLHACIDGCECVTVYVPAGEKVADLIKYFKEHCNDYQKVFFEPLCVHVGSEEVEYSLVISG